MFRRAKIVATLGPGSQDAIIIRQLIKAGMDVARLNFSHGTHEEHRRMISTLRKISSELGKPVTILQDLQGPKLRVGILPEGGIELSVDQTVILKSIYEAGDCQATRPDALFIPLDVPSLSKQVNKASRILLDDGHLELEVTGVENGCVITKVILGGALTSQKGVNLPGCLLDIPSFTEKDRQDLEFGLLEGIDVIAISFVRTAGDVKTVRQAISKIAPSQAQTPIIAKLERPEAIINLEEILAVADGVMVARGDLAVETSPAAVPIIQKKIIEAANQRRKIVITATQMLDSMIGSPRPTRAEASDVANAIFDGSDALMLSGETAVGRYPVESVRMMDAIIQEAEQHFAEWGKCETSTPVASQDDAVSITRAARELAHDRDVAGIAVFTETGRTALLMSKERPRVPILAFTPDPATFQHLSLYWGVIPHLVPFASSVEMMLSHVEAALSDAHTLNPGEQVVLISGFPVGAMRPPNFALLYTLGEPL